MKDDNLYLTLFAILAIGILTAILIVANLDTAKEMFELCITAGHAPLDCHDAIKGY